MFKVFSVHENIISETFQFILFIKSTNTNNEYNRMPLLSCRSRPRTCFCRPSWCDAAATRRPSASSARSWRRSGCCTGPSTTGPSRTRPPSCSRGSSGRATSTAGRSTSTTTSCPSSRIWRARRPRVALRRELSHSALGTRLNIMWGVYHRQADRTQERTGRAQNLPMWNYCQFKISKLLFFKFGIILLILM